MDSPVDSRERQEALGAAIGALRRRERTVAELHAWLLERGTDEDLAGEVVGELVETGELDDERFAFAFAEDKRALSGWGSERIEETLVGRGLGRSLAERAASEPRDAQLERAVELLVARGEDLDDEAGRSRALGFLTRRGYEYELAYDAIRRARE